MFSPILTTYRPRAPASTCPRSEGRGHGRYPRWRERGAGARLQGKEADRLVTRFGPGVVSLLAELRRHERQATEELKQWQGRRQGAQGDRRLAAGNQTG
jgi:hypothetical protein